MHLITLATPDGRVAQRSAPTAGHKTILAALNLPEPPRFFDFTLPSHRPTRASRQPRVVTRPHHAPTAFAHVNAQIRALV